MILKDHIQLRNNSKHDNEVLMPCECCEETGRINVEVLLCDYCIEKNNGKKYCGSCMFLEGRNVKKILRTVKCQYCSGTGYRTWIDEIRRPYRTDGIHKAE